MYFSNNFNFPKQRVSAAERNKFEYYANCCDYVIAAGKSIARDDEVEQNMLSLKGRLILNFIRKLLIPIMLRKRIYSFSSYYAQLRYC